jgi:hypothetical protein
MLPDMDLHPLAMLDKATDYALAACAPHVAALVVATQRREAEAMRQRAAARIGEVARRCPAT